VSPAFTVTVAIGGRRIAFARLMTRLTRASRVAGGLLAPVGNGVRVTVGNGYNSPPKGAVPLATCNIGIIGHDHCRNQRFALDLYPDATWNRKILAPASGTVSFIDTTPAAGPCVLITMSDGNNVTICHFAAQSAIQVAVKQKVARGDVLGTSGTDWIHMNVDYRPKNTRTCTGGWIPDTAYFCPVAFTGSDAFEGQDLVPDGSTNQLFGPFVSSNASYP